MLIILEGNELHSLTNKYLLLINDEINSSFFNISLSSIVVKILARTSSKFPYEIKFVDFWIILNKILCGLSIISKNIIYTY